MTLKKVTLIVLIALITSLALSLATYPYNHLGSMPRLGINLLSLLLRDGALIAFLVYLFRRS